MALPPKGFIKKFVGVTLAKMEEESASARGDIGSAISNACENKHVEKRALSIVRRLHKMPDKKFQETWFHMQEYFADMDFQRRADRQMQFDLKRAPADDGDDGAAAEADQDPQPSGGTMLRVVPTEDETEDEAAA